MRRNAHACLGVLKEIAAVVRLALAARVAVQPLSMFRVDQPALAGLALGYGAIEDARIDEGLRRLRVSFDAK